MKLFWFVEGDQVAACPRHRAYIYKKHLENYFEKVRISKIRYSYKEIRIFTRQIGLKFIKNKLILNLFEGISTEIVKLFGNYVKIPANKILSCFLYDIFIFQRCYPSFLQKLLLILMHKKIFFDIDDAIYLNPPIQNQNANCKEGSENFEIKKKIESIIKICNGVIVSNEYLKRWSFKIHNNIRIIPTSQCVDINYIKKKNWNSNKIIGWTGAIENQKYILEILPVFSKLVKSHSDIKLHLVTKKHWNYNLNCIKNILWDLTTYEDEIKKFAIGFAPLKKSNWTEGKMQFKAIQYMSFGIPTIASSVGFNMEHWKHGENILFADTIDEWYNSFKLLLNNITIRNKIGLNGFNTVNKYYSPEVNSILLKEFILS